METDMSKNKLRLSFAITAAALLIAEILLSFSA